MRTLLLDVIFAARQLRHHRAYAITTMLSMALGIGAAAAVYSVLYGVLIDPYPYRDPNRIAFITVRSEKDSDWGDRRLTLRQAEQLRGFKSVADVMVQSNWINMIATDGDLPVSIHAEQFTGNGFEFLGAPPMMGRFFTAAEAPVGVEPPPVAVISYLFWRTHYDSRKDVIGRQLELNHRKYTIIGVAGPRFTWGDNDVYLPMPANLDPEARYQTLIRLRQGVSTVQAAGDLTPLIAQDNRDHPKIFGPDKFRVEVQTLNDYLLGRFKGTLFLLFSAVGLLLLIGCGNVSILMLARGNTRQREIAMRSALGASRLRILRQLLTEAVVLSLAGAVLGIGLAYLGIRLITALAAGVLHTPRSRHLDQSACARLQHRRGGPLRPGLWHFAGASAFASSDRGIWCLQLGRAPPLPVTLRCRLDCSPGRSRFPSSSSLRERPPCATISKPSPPTSASIPIPS